MTSSPTFSRSTSNSSTLSEQILPLPTAKRRIVRRPIANAPIANAPNANAPTAWAPMANARAAMLPALASNDDAVPSDFHSFSAPF
jgi:hypothetical protein